MTAVGSAPRTIGSEAVRGADPTRLTPAPRRYRISVSVGHCPPPLSSRRMRGRRAVPALTGCRSASDLLGRVVIETTLLQSARGAGALPPHLRTIARPYLRRYNGTPPRVPDLRSPTRRPAHAIFLPPPARSPARRDRADDGADLPLPDDDDLRRQPVHPRRERRRLDHAGPDRQGQPAAGRTSSALARRTGASKGRTGRRRSTRSTRRSTARRPDLRAIVHAHPVALVAFSICRKVPDTSLFPQAGHVCGQVGYAPYALPGSEQLGQQHRRGVRPRVRLRPAGEPRRRHRRARPCRRRSSGSRRWSSPPRRSSRPASSGRCAT